MLDKPSISSFLVSTADPTRHRPFAEPELTLTWEKLSEGVDEALPLFRKHYYEAFDFTDRFPFNPQWEYYFALERAGCLHCLAMRAAGTLIGYVSISIHPMLHTMGCIRARGDSFYIEPAWRGTGKGLGSLFLRSIKASEAHMRELGCHRMEWVPKRANGQHTDAGPIFKRLGYIEVEYSYAKLL